MGKKLSTFSIVAFDPKAQELGVAVQSKYLASASIVPWCEAGVGAIATQAHANTSYGPKGLALLKEGKTPQEVVGALTGEDENSRTRQLGIVASNGESASFTGEECIGWAGGITGRDFAVQGNVLKGEETIQAMAQAFQETQDTLARRLVQSLMAGEKAGGDKRGLQSAGLLVVKEKGGYGGFNDRYIDLRVDDHKAPIQELMRILDLFYLYSSPPSGESIKIEGPLIIEIKENLNRLGYYDGGYEEVYDSDLREALSAFYFSENLEEKRANEGSIYKEILMYMHSRVEEV